MKEITKMSRLTYMLEKMFKELNTDFFDGVLEMPVITVSPSSNSFAHYTPWNAWDAGENKRREINIASGTLNRPLENICASLLHEMCHQYNDTILNISDTSRNGTYHNKYFRHSAEEKGLICTRTEKYGWSRTEPSDNLIEWLLNHLDTFKEIEMCRNEFGYTPTGTGANAADSGLTISKGKGNSHSIRYICPTCHAIARTTRPINLMCADCMQMMIGG